MKLKVNIDISDLKKELKSFTAEIEKELQTGVQTLAAVTHLKVKEMASQELHSSRKKFDESLGFEQIAEGLWVVSVDEKGLFIEEGIESGTDMKPWLLKNGKTSKDGHKYKVIPFEHSKAATEMTPYAQNIAQQLRTNLKKANIPFHGIETHENGKPKLGKLHSMSFPVKFLEKAIHLLYKESQYIKVLQKLAMLDATL